MRYKLASLKLIPHGHAGPFPRSPSRNYEGVNSSQRIDPAQPKLVCISEGLSSRYMEVLVQPLVRSRPTTEKDGDHDAVDCRTTSCTAYTLTDMNATVEAYARYIPRIAGFAFRKFTGPSDGLLRLTYRMACQIYQGPETPGPSVGLLNMTFTLWTAVRLLTMPAFVVGGDALGIAHCIPQQNDPATFGYAVPPEMGAGLRLALIYYIQQMVRPRLVNKLQEMMCLNRRNEWLTTYLATFILLHHLSLLLAHDANEARRRGTAVCRRRAIFPAGRLDT